MSFLAGSGDFGSLGLTKVPVSQGGTVLSTPEVWWPASDPLVTAVGGTNLCTDVFTGKVNSTAGPVDCQANPGQRETAWNGSGGGFSKVFERPGYQSSLPAGSTDVPADSRGVPDISMNASCRTYVVFLDTAPGFGGYYGACGTSEATPMTAGLVAITDQAAGRRMGNLGPALYQLAASDPGVLYDVTAGNNTQAGSGVPGFPATTGWDAVTGLGTPVTRTLSCTPSPVTDAAPRTRARSRLSGIRHGLYAAQPRSPWTVSTRRSGLSGHPALVQETVKILSVHRASIRA